MGARSKESPVYIGTCGSHWQRQSAACLHVPPGHPPPTPPPPPLPPTPHATRLQQRRNRSAVAGPSISQHRKHFHWITCWIPSFFLGEVWRAGWVGGEGGAVPFRKGTLSVIHLVGVVGERGGKGRRRGGGGGGAEGGEKDRDRLRERDRQTQIERQRERQTQTGGGGGGGGETGGREEIERQTDRDRERHRQRQRQKERQRGGRGWGIENVTVGKNTEIVLSKALHTEYSVCWRWNHVANEQSRSETLCRGEYFNDFLDY